jgi:hypothetical protein
MKRFLKFFFMITVFSLVIGCTNTDDSEFDNATLSKKNSEEMVTLGFNLVFTGTYEYQGPDEAKCGAFPPLVNVINIGEGTGTHFGKVTSHFDFCVDVTDSSYPNGFEAAYFEDENGDKLYVYVEGFVLGGRVPGMPSYATSYFKDPFEIIGGTGRFEGATGYGMTNDYNSANDPYSHHHWKGKITLKKGK